MSKGRFPHGLGCVKSPPDSRDFTLVNAPPVRPVVAARWMLAAAAPTAGAAMIGPASSDMSTLVTRNENQGLTQDCVGYAWSTVLEIVWERSERRSRQLDPAFIVNNARFLEGRPSGSATTLRGGLQALRTWGSYPIHWPKDISEARLFSWARHYSIDAYWRLDNPINSSGAIDYTQSLVQLRVLLSCGCPAVVGFFIFDEAMAGADGIIHYPADPAAMYGGHAIACVGHDDARDCGASGIGAIRVANSWGESWGKAGFGWLPYMYFRKGLVFDCWAVTAGKWQSDVLVTQS